MTQLVSVKNLKLGFIGPHETKIVVSDVSFTIDKGKVVVLAGESGSGKTLTSLAITRILPSNAEIIQGEILFEGRDVRQFNVKELTALRGKDIAYIFQEPASFLNPVYTIGAQISEAIMLHQQKDKSSAWQEVLSLLSQVKIRDPERVRESYPHQLSGGMNQRAFLAMALACRPRLLIADEPTTSLDVTIEAEIVKLLMELKQTIGFSLLFITHNLAIARRIADKICVMYQGRMVETAGVEQIFSSPGHAHTKELISAYERIGTL